MRFIFKTEYNQDITAGQTRRPCVLVQLAGHVFGGRTLGGARVLAGAADLCADLRGGGLGPDAAGGFTGLFSLGHAAFLGVGAYTQAVMVNAGVPFPLALVCAGLFSAIVGVIVGLPALRVKGIYLGMATLAFGFIVEEGMARWERVTGGNRLA